MVSAFITLHSVNSAARIYITFDDKETNERDQFLFLLNPSNRLQNNEGDREEDKQ